MHRTRLRAVVVASLVGVAALSAWAAASPPHDGQAPPGDAVKPFQAVAGAIATPAVATPSAGNPATPVPTPIPTPGPAASPAGAALGRHAAIGAKGRVRAVALGDSLTAWPAGDPWPSRLAAIDPHVALVHDAGVPGNTTSQMLGRFGRDVVRYSPGLLFVLGGTNDVGRGIPASTAIANLRAIVRLGKGHGMIVVLLTIPPDSFRGEVARVRSLNAAIRGLASTEAVPVVDIYSPLATTAGLYRAGYTVDGLHFSSAGAQVVAQTVRTALATLGL